MGECARREREAGGGQQPEPALVVRLRVGDGVFHYPPRVRVVRRAVRVGERRAAAAVTTRASRRERLTRGWRRVAEGPLLPAVL